PVDETGQLDLALAVFARRRVEHVLNQRQAGEARERVIPPRAVIDAVGHRLAELAVTGHIDAERLLMFHDVDGRGAKLILKRLFITLAFPARAVRENEILRARQAAGMARQNVVGAVAHRPSPLFCRRLSEAPKGFAAAAASEVTPLTGNRRPSADRLARLQRFPPRHARTRPIRAR